MDARDRIDKLLSVVSKGETLRNYFERKNKSIPDVIALIALASGGSHFLIDSLNASSEIAGFTEKNIGESLKTYFGRSTVSANQVQKNFFTPNKELSQLRYVVLNKPDIRDVYYQFPFAREHIRMILLVRNPVTRCMSWIRGWTKLLERDYGGAKIDLERIFTYVVSVQFMQLLDFFEGYRADMDFVVSLEGFTMFPEKYMHLFSSRLDLPEWNIQKKSGAVDFHGGGYRHDRIVTADELVAWKDSKIGMEIFAMARNAFGDRFMDFYDKQEYVQENHEEQFLKNCLELVKDGSRVLPQFRMSVF